MYKVTIKDSFSGAHNLRGYKGKCEELHGHNWHVEVTAGSEKLNDLGMVIDFKELKSVLEKVISEMDHKYLNKIKEFSDMNPTSENIARYIYKKISQKLPGLKFDGVTVWETASSSATYSE